MNSKMTLIALGLATLVATPAFAQKPTHRAYAADAYASAVTQPVVTEGRVIGTDPDPSIRSELQRDSSTSGNHRKHHRLRVGSGKPAHRRGQGGGVRLLALDRS